ncbi:MAG: serine hydroxymethyltransferase, partial [Pseudomonadota bacterium]
AGKAVAFGEALTPEFKQYAADVIENAKAMAQAAKDSGLDLVSGGTDTHVALIDLRPKGVTGRDAEHALERAYITCNKNGVPFDPEKPMVTSGIRVGSPAGTTRGFGVEEFTQVGKWIGEVVDAVASGDSAATESKVRAEVEEMTAKFPIYNGLGA